MMAKKVYLVHVIFATIYKCVKFAILLSKNNKVIGERKLIGTEDTILSKTIIF